MADIKKFLDQAGVSTLWTQIAAEVKKVNDKVATNANDISTLKGKVEALEAGTYDDTQVRGLITANTEAIATLNADENTAGSVKKTAAEAAAAEVAKVVAGADESYDTLKEIADWILNDTTGAVDMANDIAALEAKLEGVDTTVVKSIGDAINSALKIDNVDKYALASSLTDLATRVTALEDAGYQNAAQVGSAIDTKIAALDLSNTYETKGAATDALTNAKAYADGLAGNYDVSGAATTAETNAKAYADTVSATALSNAKAYTDTEISKIQALTSEEISAAINAAKASV